MNDDGKLDQLLNEMTRFKIDILGASETHWTTDTQEAFEHQNFVILQAGRNDGLHQQGVALIINKEFSKSVTSYQAISERLICATFNTVEGPTTVFQTYAPDSSYSNETSENFYDLLQDKIKALPRNNKYILLGDFNAKVGTDQEENWPREVGKYGLGQANDRGYHLLQFCAINELVITNTLFKHKKA